MFKLCSTQFSRQVLNGCRSSAVGLNKTCKYVLYCTSSGLKEKIDKLVRANKVVVFMKGIPEEPRCGFSNAVVQVMNMHGVKYNSHDVLADESLRQEIKEYTSWPTIPQVFINGEFIGGCDIILQMHQGGELIEELEKVGIRSALLDRHEQKSSNSGEKET